MGVGFSQEEMQQLKTELEQKTSELAQLRAELMEIFAAVCHLRADIAFREGVLALYETSTNDLDLLLQMPSEFPEGEKRQPSDMLRIEYKGMKLADIAVLVLSRNAAPLTTTELTHLIYETKSDEEFHRARNSLSAELRAGAKGRSPKWKKIGRNAYSSISLQVKPSTSQSDTRRLLSYSPS